MSLFSSRFVSCRVFVFVFLFVFACCVLRVTCYVLLCVATVCLVRCVPFPCHVSPQHTHTQNAHARAQHFFPVWEHGVRFVRNTKFGILQYVPIKLICAAVTFSLQPPFHVGRARTCTREHCVT